MNVTKGRQLYEGKAKKVFETEDPELYIVEYKDDATAFNGQKRGTIAGKGVINNKITNKMMTYLMEKGIPTHFVKELSDRETLVKKVEIIPLEVIVRNRATGSFVKRFGVPDGMEFDMPVVEFSYKNDELGDPPINTSQALALKLATYDEIKEIKKYALAINAAMSSFFFDIGIELVDFKLEFGRLPGGGIILADEISPDTCRFWDVRTKEKLDKDRFRQNLGGVEDAYTEMLYRVVNKVL
ncbi:MAG: phosphoribosylaminoimidazolesuccinocarboxamide synthase [Eubacteriales bacterium]|jgi:phosphoribosylaminoimidazole-succinocarboxamide synthase|nr:phosphoribosylaminoimidazolesuccinocarboxamide synthase [Clostridiales bacterium]